MKKLIIVVLFALASGTLIRSMQEAATSKTATDTSKKRPVSDDDNDDKDTSDTNRGKEKISKKINPSNLLKIPMYVEESGIAPDGVIDNNTLYLNLGTQVPILLASFNSFITEQLTKSKPVILAVATTKFNGVYNYHIYEASTTTWFYGNNFNRNRYTIPPNQFPTEPSNRQPILNEVMFFILYNKNKPVEYLGSDYDLFQGTDDQKELLYLTLMANSDNIIAMNNLGILYIQQNKPDLAEQYLKQAADLGNAAAMKNLGDLYIQQNKLDLAEQYYKQALRTNPNQKLKEIINKSLAHIAKIKSGEAQ